MKYVRRNINTVFLMLGNSCNMNCAYCLQHPLVHKALTREVNPEIYDFLEEVINENTRPLHLQFYGGEPLLYFGTIQEVVAAVKQRKLPITFGIITNGRALTDEMVRFFNARNFTVCVSWDGPHVRETRGYDVFSVPETRERILALGHLCLSAVLSAKAYPREVLQAFQQISEEYSAIHGYQIAVNLDEIMDTGLPKKDLLAIDYGRVAREMKEMTLRFLDGFGKRVPVERYTEEAYIRQLFHALKEFYLTGKGKWNRYTAACGNGLTVLNLDLQGNLYPCHNTSRKVGTIRDGYFSYLQRILAGDHTREHRKECLSCTALAFCQGGCKLVGDKARKESYCKFKRAVFTPVLMAIQQYGQKLLEKNHGKERNHQ